MLKKCFNFKLLSLVSMSNFMLAYSIQSLLVFLVFCTNIKLYINVCMPNKKLGSTGDQIIEEIDQNNDLKTYL